MQLTPLKLAIATLWITAVGVLGLLTPVDTLRGWIALVGFGLLPSVFMLRAWRRPQQTLSQSIQSETRR